MRRLLGPLLSGLGAFLLIAGVLVAIYAYPKLAVAPRDQNSVTSLEASGATLFDTGTLQNITTDLSVQNRTVADTKASDEAPDGVQVWVSTTSIRSADGVVRSRSVDRYAFDEVSAEAKNCCGAFTETTEGERTPIKRSGLVLKYPFDTEKKTYQVWEGTLGDTAPAKYTGTTTVQGVEVYKFETSIPDTVVGTREVPGALFDSTEPAVDADVHYQVDRVTYVEPKTGGIVNREDDTKSWLSFNGVDIVTTEAQLHYTDKEIDEMIDTVERKAMLLGLARVTGPIVLGVLGLALLVAGLLITFRGRKDSDAVSQDRELSHA